MKKKSYRRSQRTRFPPSKHMKQTSSSPLFFAGVFKWSPPRFRFSPPLLDSAPSVSGGGAGSSASSLEAAATEGDPSCGSPASTPIPESGRRMIGSCEWSISMEEREEGECEGEKTLRFWFYWFGCF